jgi:hypothetical protein
MKAYILTKEDFDMLLFRIDRAECGYSRVRDPQEQEVWDRVRGLYNYQIRKWIDEVQS